METELFGIILGAMGSVASLISLLFSLQRHTSRLISMSLALILLLTGTSSYFSYQYYQISKIGVIKQKQRELMQTTIRSFLDDYPTSPSYWNPGQNEGIVKSGLIILEMNKELFPETYDKIKSDIEKDMVYAQQHRDQQEHRQAIKVAADNIYFVLKTLSGKPCR